MSLLWKGLGKSNEGREREREREREERPGEGKAQSVKQKGSPGELGAGK